MSICLECGLCCDGTIFALIELKEADNPTRLAELGVGLMHRESKDCVVLPCTAFRLRRCSIYQQTRPVICRDFRCVLLKHHEAGEISTDQALSIIREAVDARKRIRPEIERFVNADGHLSLHHLLRLMADKMDTMEADERRLVNPAMRLDVGILRILLARYFEWPKSPSDQSAALA